jgi:hypothetical protein
MKQKYNECLEMLHAAKEELRELRRKYSKKAEMRLLREHQLYAPWMTVNSFAAECHFGLNKEKKLNE